MPDETKQIESQREDITINVNPMPLLMLSNLMQLNQSFIIEHFEKDSGAMTKEAKEEIKFTIKALHNAAIEGFVPKTKSNKD